MSPGFTPAVVGLLPDRQHWEKSMAWQGRTGFCRDPNRTRVHQGPGGTWALLPSVCPHLLPSPWGCGAQLGSEPDVHPVSPTTATPPVRRERENRHHRTENSSWSCARLWACCWSSCFLSTWLDVLRNFSVMSRGVQTGWMGSTFPRELISSTSDTLEPLLQGTGSLVTYCHPGTEGQPTPLHHQLKPPHTEQRPDGDPSRWGD